MNNTKKAIFVAIIGLLITGGWFGYQKLTDDTYEGMSIIPEQHDDIPLFPGLEPTRDQYEVKGDHWREIYDFYLEELPKLGWKKQNTQSALEDNNPNNDWGGFISSWTKEGFDGELTIFASYNQFDEQTEVHFDQTPIYQSSTWIHDVPERICIYKDSTSQDCTVIRDENKINKIAAFINEALDWEQEATPRDKESTIDFGEIDIKIFYEKEKEIYFQSEKGTKLMKPEPEFFELIGL
ncbi:hypothetical protein AM500_13405 [Bacillus sp. FJAT-18017]|uniref:hypothetical protein n=1 Tax=Bacillus sp. FJAT-18017 TaxID=1705566 RepID=UPI0006AE95C7|nr:hypothetical protein [Bacillus sp. FJAT-18017]ALC90669.1 hypothetical protein AM500_13405 [Bacillus sp. FJAT-18017]